MEGITYEQIDTLPEATLREVLGKNAEGKNEAQMRAIIKGSMRAQEEALDEDVVEPPVAEIMDVQQEPAEPEQSDIVKDVTRAEFEALKNSINEVQRENRELKSQVASKTKLSKRAKQEAAHARCRVSNYFRDILAEQRHYHNTGETKHVILSATFQIESEAFLNGRYVPCAKNGGMYYVRNKSWAASPRTGAVRSPMVFNRHLYVDYTIKGNVGDLLRDDYALCDWHGKDVKPFQETMPIEDIEAIRKKGKARQPDIVDALSKLAHGGSL